MIKIEHWPEAEYPHFRREIRVLGVSLFYAVPAALGIDVGRLHLRWYGPEIHRRYRLPAPRMGRVCRL